MSYTQQKSDEQIVPSVQLKTRSITEIQPERPGWIPSHITENWDTNPFAYQTEEELMPAGGPHGQLLHYIVKVVQVPL